MILILIATMSYLVLSILTMYPIERENDYTRWLREPAEPILLPVD